MSDFEIFVVVYVISLIIAVIAATIGCRDEETRAGFGFAFVPLLNTVLAFFFLVFLFFVWIGAYDLSDW